MGLPRAAIHLLLDEAARQPFSGKIATLGRQHVYLNAIELQSMAKAASVKLRKGEIRLHRDPILRSKGFLSDDSLFDLLGFEQSVRIDQSSYEAADEQLDLNEPITPQQLCDAFEVVLDSGTIEHVFDIGQAMRHCLQMTRPGGRIIHLTPSSNAVNHGLYSVSPSLYADFYSASGCRIEKLWLCRMPQNFERGRWLVYDCLQTDRNWLPLGRLDRSIWFTFAVISKGPAAKAAVPQQAFYVSTWKQSLNGNTSATTSATALLQDEPATTRAGRLLLATKDWPLIHALVLNLIHAWRRFINWFREKRRGRIPFPLVGRF